MDGMESGWAIGALGTAFVGLERRGLDYLSVTTDATPAKTFQQHQQLCYTMWSSSICSVALSPDSTTAEPCTRAGVIKHGNLGFLRRGARGTNSHRRHLHMVIFSSHAQAHTQTGIASCTPCGANGSRCN